MNKLIIEMDSKNKLGALILVWNNHV